MLQALMSGFEMPCSVEYLNTCISVVGYDSDYQLNTSCV